MNLYFSHIDNLKKKLMFLEYEMTEIQQQVRLQLLLNKYDH